VPRQSKLTVAARFRPTMPGDRPFAPDSLRDDMKIEWGSVVDRLPSRWFTAIELRGLEGFCRTVCYCKEVASELDKVKLSDADDPKVDRLIARYAKLAPLVVRFARYLKLPAENQRPPVAVARMRGAALDVVPPWETDDD